MSVSENLLLQIANKSNMTTQYACVIEYRGKIIATGFNHYDLKRIRQDQPCLL